MLKFDKQKKLLHVTAEINRIRDTIPFYTLGNKKVRNYSTQPESCVKVILLLQYAIDHITKRKDLLKRHVGSILELYNGWISQCLKNKSKYSYFYQKLNEERYIEKFIKNMESKLSDSKISSIVSRSSELIQTQSEPDPIKNRIQKIEAANIVHKKDSLEVDSFERKINIKINRNILTDNYIQEVVTRYSLKKEKEILFLLKTKPEISYNECEKFISELLPVIPKCILRMIFRSKLVDEIAFKLIEKLKIIPYWNIAKEKVNINPIGEFAIRKNKEQEVITLINQLKNEKITSIDQIIFWIGKLYNKLEINLAAHLLNLNRSQVQIIAKNLNLKWRRGKNSEKIKSCVLNIPKGAGISNENSEKIIPTTLKSDGELFTQNNNTNISINLSAISDISFDDEGNIILKIYYGSVEHKNLISSMPQIRQLK